MTPAMQSFAYGAGSFAVYALAALGALRLPGKISPVARQFWLALLIHVGTTAAGMGFLESIPYWHGAALYWCSFIVALFGYSAVYKSISLEILRALARKGDYGLSLNEISEAHVWPSFLSRTRTLVAAGYVVECNGQFQLTEAGRRLARRIAAIQTFFGVTRSGLYGPSE